MKSRKDRCFSTRWLSKIVCFCCFVIIYLAFSIYLLCTLRVDTLLDTYHRKFPFRFCINKSFIDSVEAAASAADAALSLIIGFPETYIFLKMVDLLKIK